MMTQDDLVVVGIDVAKDKIDACIRTVTERKTCPTTAAGRRSLIAWLRKHQVGKAVMEASGGYERVWAKALRQAGLEVRIVDPKRVRHFAESAGRLAKNDKIDAEMISWFAETFGEAPSQVDNPAHEEMKALVKGRQGLLDVRARLEMQKEHEAPALVQRLARVFLRSWLTKSPRSRPRSRRRSRQRRTLPNVPRSSRAYQALLRGPQWRCLEDYRSWGR